MLAIKYDIHWNKIKGFKLPFKDPKNSAKFIFQKTSFLAPDFFCQKCEFDIFVKNFRFQNVFLVFYHPLSDRWWFFLYFWGKETLIWFHWLTIEAWLNHIQSQNHHFFFVRSTPCHCHYKLGQNLGHNFLPISFKATTVSGFFVLNESLKS